MNLLTPAALFLGFLALPIIVLYMLRLRRREVKVPSTMLWQMVIRDREANRPWQRLRRNILLLLQLLILAALAFALARPVLATRSIAKGNIIIILDASASMNATDVTPSRFDQALDEVHEIIDALDVNSQITIVLASNEPEILVSGENDRQKLRATIADLSPTQGESDWEAVFALAVGTAGLSQTPPTTVILSDGGIPGDKPYTLPGEVRYIPIGTNQTENLGITALSLRAVNTDTALFARVQNFGATDRSAWLNVKINEGLFYSEQINLGAGEELPVVLESLPNEAQTTQVSLTHLQPDLPLDDFTLDDTAYSVFLPPQNRNVLLVSERRNIFLEELLALMPNITPFRAIPDEEGALEIPNEAFGLIIYDGFIVEPVPSNSAVLLINPPANPFFSVGEYISDFGIPVLSEHPVGGFIDWNDVNIAQTRRIAPPAWAEIVLNSDKTPIIFVGNPGSQRVGVIGFDLYDSDLPLRIAFPVLFSNMIEFLIPSNFLGDQDSVQPNEAVPLPQESGTVLERITNPSDKFFAIEEGASFFRDTDEVGIYSITFENGLEQAFAVNLFSEAESAIQVNEEIQVGHTTVNAGTPEEVGEQPIWPWLALGALLVLAIEWYVYYRRG